MHSVPVRAGMAPPTRHSTARSAAAKFARAKCNVFLQSRRYRSIRCPPLRFKSDEQTEYIQLPLDHTELLGLSGRTSYLFCDVTGAYNDLVQLPSEEGFADTVLEGRRELLDMVKEAVVLSEGRVADLRAVNVPVQLLPSALVLLTQIGHNDLVAELAPPLLENWEVRKKHKRDILLALALAYCGQARELFDSQQTAAACTRLDEALELLRRAGSPPLAPHLVEDIEAGLAGLEVPRVLDQLRSAPTADSAAARKWAVGALRSILTSPTQVRAPDGTVVDADYVRLAMAAMGAPEIVRAADWAAVARNPRSVPWAWPAMQHMAALAHIAVGFTQRQPELIKQAMTLLRSASTPASAEATVARAVCEVLLGNTDGAAVGLKNAAKAPMDADMPWPVQAHAHGAPSDGEQEAAHAAGGQRLPGPHEVYDFVCSNSPEDERDLLPGMCLFTEMWLANVVFAQFDVGASEQPSTSLPAYFGTMRVEQQLQHAWPGARVAEQLADAMRAAQSGVAHVVRLAGRFASRSPAGAQRPGASEVSDGAPLSPATSGGRLLAAAAGSVLLVGVAAAVIVVVVAMRRSGATGTPRFLLSHHQQGVKAAVAAMAAPDTPARPGVPRSLDLATATHLLQQWQRAKAAALGPRQDVGGLKAVLAEPLLAQKVQSAKALAASGWYYRHTLRQLQVCGMEAGRGGVTVRAQLEEAASLQNKDGRAGGTYDCCYEVQYELVGCADGQWRISTLKVLTKQPVSER